MRAAFVSFRLGGFDGVAVESAKWQSAFRRLGWEVTGVAGEGPKGGGQAGGGRNGGSNERPSPPDHLVAGLGLEPGGLIDEAALARGLAGADLAVVDNLLSLPLNPPASEAVARALAGRPCLVHHHDLPWQHPRWERPGWSLPDDPEWAHVVPSEISRRQMKERGVDSTVVHNAFAGAGPSDRVGTRTSLGVGPDERLFLHPGRAIWRKNIGEGLRLAAALDATYWLTGAVEQEYGPEVDRHIAATGVRFIHQAVDNVDDAYAACDAVVFPSTWEGFGNPPFEASIRSRPVAVGSYPVGRELAVRYGLRWFDSADPAGLGGWLAAPDQDLLEHNRRVVEEQFGLGELDTSIARLLRRWGW